jgi:hypothetical protein
MEELSVVQLIDSLHWGGAQKLLLTLAEAIRGHDVRLTIISLREHRPDVSLPTELAARGAHVEVMSAPHLFDVHRFERLTHYLRQARVDVLHFSFR